MHILHPHLYPGGGPVLSYLQGGNGVNNLDPNLTINGTTVTPEFRYKLGDADGTNLDPWTYGSILPLSVGTPVYNNGSPLLGSNDDSADLNSGYYQDTGNTTGDVSTEDIVIETIYKHSGGTKGLVGKGLAATGDTWGLYTGTANIRFRIEVSSANIDLQSLNLVDGAWYHVIAFINRDEASTNGSQMYINAVASGAGVDFSANAGSASNSENMRLGTYGNITIAYDSNIAYLAMWLQASWHQAGAAGPTEWAAIAKERFEKLTGFYSPKGTVTYARASEAVLNKREGSADKLYTLGDGWPRMDKVVDSASTELIGYRAETADINELLYSEDFSDVTWVKTRCTISSDGLAAPNKETTADGIIGTAVSDTHYVSQAITSSAAEHIFSVYAKAGDQDWLYLDSPGTANADAYFDLATPALGTVGAGATAYIKDLGGGWCRCSIVYTGIAASHSHDIYAAEADNDITFTGDGSTENVWIWGATHSDQALVYPTSYIKTLGSTVTRVKDNFGPFTQNVELPNKGTMECMMLLPNHDSTINKRLLYLSDGGSANESIDLWVDPTGDVLGAIITEGGVSRYDDGCTTDIADGVIHKCSVQYSTGSANQKCTRRSG
jgi:hypothetical protein